MDLYHDLWWCTIHLIIAHYFSVDFLLCWLHIRPNKSTTIANVKNTTIATMPRRPSGGKRGGHLRKEAAIDELGTTLSLPKGLRPCVSSKLNRTAHAKRSTNTRCNSHATKAGETSHTIKFTPFFTLNLISNPKYFIIFHYSLFA